MQYTTDTKYKNGDETSIPYKIYHENCKTTRCRISKKIVKNYLNVNPHKQYWAYDV